MALKGDLASVDLAQVFQMLALNQKVGMLCINSPRGWRALYFEPRGASLYFNEHAILDRVLLQSSRTGRLEAEAVQEARDHASVHGIHLADALTAGGYLSDAELAGLLRTEIEEEIFDLFFWNDATFEFYEGATTVEGREGRIDERFFFSTDTLIMEAARRIDEWAFIQERVRGPLEIFRPIGGRSTNILDLEDSALSLYDLVDGKRNVARLIEITGLPSFVVYKGLAVLLDEGMVDHAPVADLLPTAQNCVDEGRFQDAINLYERAIALGEGIPTSHEQAARVYETVQEYELAAYHHKCVAEFHAGAEDYRRAVEILRHVVGMLPTDLAARERLVELTVGRPEAHSKGFDPVANGKELVELYVEVGEVERVRSILERLLRDNPFDIELKKSLINVHSKAGDTKRVIELYESIAEDLVQQRQPIEAVKYLQKILMLDRNRKDISERIRSLYVMDERRRSRRRSLVALTAVGLFLVALSAIWWMYEQHARDRLVAVEGRVAKLLEQEDYHQAAATYREFMEKFPLTLVSQEVDAELTHVESLREKHKQLLENELRKHRLELDKIRKGYKLAWSIYKGMIDDKLLDHALDQIEAVAEMVEQAGEAEDHQWAQHVGLDQNRRELKDYIARGFDLDRTAHDQFEAGDWQAARATWMELIRDYGMTDSSASIKLPVLLRSRPEGAVVYRDGEPMKHESGKPLVTPCVVLCNRGLQFFELRMPGFANSILEFESEKSEVAEVVLSAKPSESFSFEEPVTGGLAVRKGLFAAGLRGGRIALVRTDRTREHAILQLPGLDEIEGEPDFTSNAVVFATRESGLASYSLSTGESLWNVKLRYTPAYDIQVRDGRVLFVDTEGRMMAIDANRGGSPLWFTTLGGSAAARPTIDRRFAWVGLMSGQLVKLDLIAGAIVSRTTVAAAPITPVYPRRGAVVFGTEDGRVVALYEGSAKVLWNHELDEGEVVQRMVVDDDHVIVATSQNRLLRMSLRRGDLEASGSFEGHLASELELRAGEILMTLRERLPRHGDHDVLRAFDLRNLGLRWEYAGTGRFSAGFEVFEGEVWLGDTDGTVRRFE